MPDKPWTSSAAFLQVPRLVQEFLPLNRRRVEANPPLSARELSRWGELRNLLERSLGGVPPPGVEVRRRSLRVPVQLPVRYTNGVAAGTGRSIDLSEGGIFVATPEPLRPHTPLHLEIDAQPGRPPVEAPGAVVWERRPPSEAERGMGIRFENLELHQERAIVRLVENALACL